MRRPLPVFLLMLLAALLAGSLASVAANAATQPTTSTGFDPAARTAVTAERGEQIARDHLLANADVLGVSPADLSDLLVDLNEADDVSGVRYVKFMQAVGGVPIYNAMLNVTIASNGDVVYVGNRGVLNAAGSVNTRTPSLSAADAIAAAAEGLGLRYSAASVVAEQAYSGATQKVRYSGGDLSLEDINVSLRYQPVDSKGGLRLAWNLDIYQRDGLHWWDLRVDALTGEILHKTDRAVSENWDALLNDPGQVPTGAIPGHINTIMGSSFAVNITAPYAPSMVGSYRVYAMPVESPNHGARTLVANPDNATASPFGWHDTNGVAGAEFTITRGNNVYAYTDTDANGTPDAGSAPDGGAGLLFDFPIDLTQAPSAYRPAAVTNLFYWSNILHDVSYVHGFTPQFRNFQTNNYGGGGLGNDPMNSEAQDGATVNNAQYFHSADGTSPRLQMYLWTAPNPDRDGDLDNGIILHEYGHGISLRLTGDGISCLNNAEQMGEGWSDYQSIMLTQRASDTATTTRGVGTYALNQPTTGPGIRPAPYTTDMAVNNYTYANLPSLAVPHGVGFLWATILWDMNWQLIDTHGFNPDIYGAWSTGGNNLAYRLVHDGMKTQPCSPGFVDGRDAILAADQALTGGANQCDIWEAFARRGVGSGASQGSPNSTSDGTPSTALPPQCTGGPTFTPTATRTPTATLPAGAQVVTYCSTFAPVSIPDNLPAAGVTTTLTIPAAATILDANVRISATHSWVGDLTFRLTNGTTSTTVVARPGGTGTAVGCNDNNIDDNFVDDEGTGNWESACTNTNTTPAYPAGTRMVGGDPANPALMSVYDGASTAGTWSMYVTDSAAQDTGTFNQFCMEFLVPGGSTPTATPTTQGTTPTATATAGGSTPTATATCPAGNGAWTANAVMTTPVIRYGFVQNTTDFYVISGVNGSFQLSAAVQRYNVASNSWSALASIPIPAENPAASLWNGKIYVAGGSVAGASSTNLQIYDIATNTWSTGAPMTTAVWGAAAGAFNGKVYVAGGFGSTAPTTGLQVYDIATNTWSAGTALPGAYHTGGYTQVGQYLYIVGSYGATAMMPLHEGGAESMALPAPDANSNVSQRLDLSNGTWTTGPNFTPQRADFALASDGTKLYAIGGDTTGGTFFNPSLLVDELNISAWPAGTWTASTPNLPTIRQANQAGFLGNNAIWSTGAYNGSAVLGEHLSRSSGGCTTPTTTPTPGGNTPTATATAPSGSRICSSTVVTIPDNLPGGATSTINVGTAGNISDINVVLSATHSFAGDLLFNLSNGATNVTFYDRPGVPTTTFGCGGDNIPGSIADDEGSTGSWENSCGSGNPAFQPGGTYTNNNPLSAFDGQAAAGTWTLTVSDNAAADTGTLDGWCVDIATGTGPTPTATATATTTGGAPDINVTPNAFTETHGTPQTTNDTMNIQNVGSGTLTWTIVEDNSVTPVEDITDKVTVSAQDMRLRAANGSVVAERFLQSGAMAPSVGTINLVVDDGTPEDSIGLTAGGEFIWLNRFTPAPTDFPFTLTSIEFLTIGTSGCLPTDTVDFYVYTDADGNPANGATHVGSLTNQQVGTLDQYNTYATNINVTGSGDVLILAVNRTCDIAGQFPASIDLTASQVRSWVGFGGTPGNPPTLPATTFGTIDSFGFPGNWTIRGNGTQGGGGCSAPTDIPWLTVSPTNGSTAGGGSTPVTLTYNSASLANGTYTANLCIESNDADEPTVTVPITLNVGLPSAIDLASFSSPMAGVNFGDIAAAGLLLLAGAVLLLRRK